MGVFERYLVLAEMQALHEIAIKLFLEDNVTKLEMVVNELESRINKDKTIVEMVINNVSNKEQIRDKEMDEISEGKTNKK